MTAKLIEDALPVDEPIQPVTIRNHVLKLAERMGGKVHYASMKKAKGECPLCGMDLQKSGPQQK